MMAAHPSSGVGDTAGAIRVSFTLGLTHPSSGAGEDGQLGIGNNEDRDLVCAVKSIGSHKVSFVVVGSRNSLVISDDGKLFIWGWNQRGTLGHLPENKTENVLCQVKALSDVKIVQATIRGWHCLTVDDQGRAYAWGKFA